MVDEERTGLWFEVTGNTKKEALERAKKYQVGCANVLSNMTVKPSQWHSQKCLRQA